MLNKTALKDALLELFEGKPLDSQGNYTWPKDVVEAGQKWAKVYTNYAKDATPTPPGGGTPRQISLELAEVMLAELLTTAFKKTTIHEVANGIGSALGAFWTNMLFTDGSFITDSITGTVVLINALETTWVSNMAIPPPGITAVEAAEQHALLFDTYTQTVVTATPPSIVGKLV